MGPRLPRPRGAPRPRLASLYLHRAEPQQLNQDSSTATPEADMAGGGSQPPNSPARPPVGALPRTPVSGGARCQPGVWRGRSSRGEGVCARVPATPGEARVRAHACKRALRPGLPRRQKVSCRPRKLKSVFRQS